VSRSVKLGLILGAILATLAIFGALWTTDAEAVNGDTARQISFMAQGQVCGSFFWDCKDRQAPRPLCYGRGGGTWECYGGVTERHKFTLRWRNCSTYHYVGRYGGGTVRKNC
jgi:hypothetical protein